MTGVKHVLFEHILPWIRSAVKDAKAWTAFILTSILTTAGQWLAGLDIVQIEGWTKRQWALRVLITFGPPAITALVTGKPPQTADEVLSKLRAHGFDVVAHNGHDAQPGVIPAPPPSKRRAPKLSS